MTGSTDASGRIKWWEKHVEWEFVRKYVDFARAVFPIDGTFEYGDAFFATDASWWILELKGRKEYRASEFGKYPSLSKSRALSVARRVYGRNHPRLADLTSKLDACKTIPAHSTALLRWEKEVLEDASESVKDGVFWRAESALRALLRGYQYGLDGMTEVAPHLFVYPADHKFTRLNGCRYWGGWVSMSKIKSEPLGTVHKDLALHLADDVVLSNFGQYVRLLGTARGYPDFQREPLDTEEPDEEEVLFGNVLAYGRTKDGTVYLMPLQELVEALPELVNDDRYVIGKAFDI
ncbi:hypothetical protein MRS60_05490 [Burkholderia pyrrocinia]|uniref:hypothetical protein n=1 Tax=Burkholderia pyrrocinia TaxID=60550 RepID=UPI001FB3A34E|nr:hypothetical protein [Burkholderia pyrrocinia]UOB56555.1 hypothetical protein MRS60_05490 [Burkholderia pyrrocinia]